MIGRQGPTLAPVCASADTEPLRPPTPLEHLHEAGEAAARSAWVRGLANRGRWRAAPVRRRFVRRDLARADDPAAATMWGLLGDRGGDVRLKLFLSVIWLASSAPYDVTLPERSWAKLVGLDPTAGDARRVRHALEGLTRSGLVRTVGRPGGTRVVTLLDESGRGDAYRPPGEAARKEPGTYHQYLRLPSTLWTNGWTRELSGAATASLLVLLAYGAEDPAGRWLSPGLVERSCGLSLSTWRRGTRELRDLGVARARPTVVGGSARHEPRRRNVWVVDLGHLDHPAR